MVGQNTQSGPQGSSTTSTVAQQKINTSAVHFIGLGL
ncbi:CTB family bacteriocin [Nostoc sp. T09]|nr:CTB family bacteriocin [Nostoc sp. T09]